MRKMKGLTIWLIVGIFLVIGLGYAFPVKADGKIMAKDWLKVTPEHHSPIKSIRIDNGISKFKIQIAYLGLDKKILLTVTGQYAYKIFLIPLFRWEKDEEKEYQVQLADYRVIDFNFSDKVSLNYLKVVIPIPDSIYQGIQSGQGPYPELVLWGGNLIIKLGIVNIWSVEEES